MPRLAINFVSIQSNSFELQTFSPVGTVHKALLVPCCTDDQLAILKSARKKRTDEYTFRSNIARKLACAPKSEDNFWEVRLSLRPRSLFFCLNNIAVSIDLEVRGGGIFGYASLDKIAREGMRNGRRSGRMNVEFHGMVQRL